MRRMDNKSIRRANLEMLAQEAKGLGELAAKAGVNVKYLEQIKNSWQGKADQKPREMGDRVARKLEVAMGKPTGWIDMLHVASTTSHVSDATDLLSDFSALSIEEQTELRIYIKTRADIARAIIAHKKKQ